MVGPEMRDVYDSSDSIYSSEREEGNDIHGEGLDPLSVKHQHRDSIWTTRNHTYCILHV